MKRILTEYEVEAIWLCHQDYERMTTKEAAIKMGLTQRRIQQLLRSARRKAPQLFPILTKRQVAVRNFVNDGGATYAEIAEILGISVNTVNSTVRALKKKGVYLEKRKPTIQYQSWQDDKIKEKF